MLVDRDSLAATLDAFVDAAGDGVRLPDLEPMTALRVRTRNSQYRIIAAGGGTIYIQGGRFFPQMTRAHLEGSSAGGSLLKVAWIGVGFRMEIAAGGTRILTSPVLAVSHERERRAAPVH